MVRALMPVCGLWLIGKGLYDMYEMNQVSGDKVFVCLIGVAVISIWRLCNDLDG